MSIEQLKLAIVGYDELCDRFMYSLEKETNIHVEVLGKEKIIKGGINLGTQELEITCIANASEFSIEECGTALILFKANDQSKETQALIEQTQLNTEDIFGYCEEETRMNGIAQTNQIPPMPTIKDVLLIVRNIKKNRIAIGDIIALKEIEENARGALEKQREKNKRELEDFSKPIEQALKDKITEESLLLGEQSSEEVEDVHWTDEEEEKNETETQKDNRKRTGQMVFASSGKIVAAPPPLKKKRVTKPKSKTKSTKSKNK
ncbi:hypothetical protein EDI_012750 [Entamoeba dispar SAW760]|uniref:Uncharacterized protein n=1 Tax=Entamoeba dispar (strain ATCC PRA-260 / SAW760) TaxID=370354 RepID=B0E7Z3_ENTDS|nr:uncharacterized protein EDI_012750 [Entamoeba dispar SAW760]EDR29383.1 hypothetical protein EDI_012750 [Entamoeba dispar SAW760]|eukprot:EDR29383.1 hypothetical protein EDI_012750 [Entamoeba dispar SAW760]